MWAVLGLFNRIYNGFMIGHRHLKIYLGMMEKGAKVLAIYDAILPRVWAEMALQLL